MLPAAWATRPSAATAAPPVGRREIARALEFAAAGNDVDAIAWSIEQASAAGVSPDLVVRAQQRLDALMAQAGTVVQHSARQDAEARLEAAVGAGSVDMLDTAIAQAERAGLAAESTVLQHAKAERSRLAEDIRQQQARSAALAAIRDARQAMDVPALLVAVREASQVGANPELIRRDALGLRDASDQRHAMARCILRFAAQGDSMLVLDLAIGWARTEAVPEPELEAAVQRRAAITDEAKRKRSLGGAASALAAAWKTTDPQVLAEAIEDARAAGVSAEMLRLAERRLKTVMKSAALALEALGADLVGASGVGATAADSEGPVAVAAAPAAPVLDAEHVAEMQERCKEASAVLKTAMVRGDAEALASAIDQAVRVGVSRELVAPARRKLSRLQKATPPPAGSEAAA